MSKHKHEDIEVPEANLLPVMNIMFLLIPGLLLAMEVASMAAVVVTPPHTMASPQDNNPITPPDEQPLEFKVMVRGDGYSIVTNKQLEGAGAGVAQDSSAPTIPLAYSWAGGQDYQCYDYNELAQKAAQIKSAYPKESVVKINAEADVPMQVLVNTIDALRGEGCKLAESIQSGKEVSADCHFWNVVIEPMH